MKPHSPFRSEAMKHIANMLLGEPPALTGGFRTPTVPSSSNAFDYVLACECGEIHFITESQYPDFLKENENHSQIIIIKISENIFKENYRYICCRFHNSPFMDSDETVRHYDYSNYEYEELCAKIKIISILSQFDLERTTTFPRTKSFFDQSILSYEGSDIYELETLFHHMGYCNERIAAILSEQADEPLAFYFRIAIRLLYDEDIQINHVGRKIFTHLLKFQI